MIRYGLSLGLNGEWSVEQLSPGLRETITKYPKDFQGIEEFYALKESTAASICRAKAAELMRTKVDLFPFRVGTVVNFAILHDLYLSLAMSSGDYSNVDLSLRNK
jgi:hypothetical protein